MNGADMCTQYIGSQLITPAILPEKTDWQNGGKYFTPYYPPHRTNRP